MPFLASESVHLPHEAWHDPNIEEGGHVTHRKPDRQEDGE